MRLFAAHQRRIYSFVAVMVPNPTEADDVFQEVSAGLWRKFGDFEPGTDFAAWGLQFARYAVLKHFQRRRRRQRLVFGDEVLELLVEQTTLANRESDCRQEALRTCLQRLPERSRELVRVRYETGVGTCKEAASRLGRSVEAAYKALGRIHDLLLKCIESLLSEDRA